MFRDNHCDDLIDELVEDVKNRLELAALCPNCHKLPSKCLDKESPWTTSCPGPGSRCRGR